jgi:hypothetical protein
MSIAGVGEAVSLYSRLTGATLLGGGNVCCCLVSCRLCLGWAGGVVKLAVLRL